MIFVMSSAMKKACGCSDHEGETVCSVLDSEQAERMQKTDLEVFTTGKPYFGVERIILKDGRSDDTIVRRISSMMVPSVCCLIFAGIRNCRMILSAVLKCSLCQWK